MACPIHFNLPVITINLIGTLAGALTTIAFVPQVVRIWRTQHADDISTSMFVIFITGIMLWLWYGIRLNAWPIIIANSITLGLASMILVLKFHFHSKRQKN
ncbi:MAG: SemiSWEET transporter [Betaproteobacteria bacterium]|nr:SemiSWEET transporter [Betaproteobacteria bacterium]